MKNTYDYVAYAVRKYWKETYPHDVVAFFYQKYENEEEWDKRCELIECKSSDDYETVIFHNDFCEGQNCIKEVAIVSLEDVLEYYSKTVIEVLKRAD